MPLNLDGKEGVDGSSPSEGSIKCLQIGTLLLSARRTRGHISDTSAALATHSDVWRRLLTRWREAALTRAHAKALQTSGSCRLDGRDADLLPAERRSADYSAILHDAPFGSRHCWSLGADDQAGRFRSVSGAQLLCALSRRDGPAGASVRHSPSRAAGHGSASEPSTRPRQSPLLTNTQALRPRPVICAYWPVPRTNFQVPRPTLYPFPTSTHSTRCRITKLPRLPSLVVTASSISTLRTYSARKGPEA